MYYEINDKYDFPETYIVAAFHDDPSVWEDFGFSTEGLEYVKSLLFYMPVNGKNETVYDKGKEEIKRFAIQNRLTNMSDFYLMLKQQMNQRFTITCTDCEDTDIGDTAYFWISYLYFKIPFNTASPASHIWSAGYKADIQVHDPNQVLYLSTGRPYHQSVENEFYRLDLNFTYEFRIEARRIKRRQTKFKSCLKVLPSNYSCLDNCFQEMLTTYANCTSSGFGSEPVFTKGYAGPDICSNLMHDFMSCFGTHEATVLDCHSNCPPLCNEINYQYSVVKGKPFKSDVNHIYLEFRLMFTDTGFLTLEEVQSYTWQTAVCNIGGQLGLWLGISVIYIIQMWLFCVTRCLESRDHRLTKPKELSKVSPETNSKPTGWI